MGALRRWYSDEERRTTLAYSTVPAGRNMLDWTGFLDGLTHGLRGAEELPTYILPVAQASQTWRPPSCLLC
jgi:hypothetical protein